MTGSKRNWTVSIDRSGGAFSLRHWPNLTPLPRNCFSLIHRAGFHGKHVPHGFRSTFSMVMNVRFPGDRRAIDLMLAHADTGSVEFVYNRANTFRGCASWRSFTPTWRSPASGRRARYSTALEDRRSA